MPVVHGEERREKPACRFHGVDQDRQTGRDVVQPEGGLAERYAWFWTKYALLWNSRNSTGLPCAIMPIMARNLCTESACIHVCMGIALSQTINQEA